MWSRECFASQLLVDVHLVDEAKLFGLGKIFACCGSEPTVKSPLFTCANLAFAHKLRQYDRLRQYDIFDFRNLSKRYS